MVSMTSVKVGMREFREQLAQYLETDTPVAVTKHGRTVGFYIPLGRKPGQEDVAALREAGRRLDQWMAQQGLSEDELVADFKSMRKASRKRGR
jgi:antitoxin (DNA-binding transcriptional repressor) of toxin-antitoxin stability system